MGQDTNDTEWTPHFPHQIIRLCNKMTPLYLGGHNLLSPSMILLVFQKFPNFLHVCHLNIKEGNTLNAP
jgi:hypothetical protein